VTAARRAAGLKMETSCLVLLLHNVTMPIFALCTNPANFVDEQKRRQVIVNVRMQLAHLRQYLRDASELMDQDEKDQILDKMITLTKLLAELEN
jgi:hypothetical protein